MLNISRKPPAIHYNLTIKLNKIDKCEQWHEHEAFNDKVFVHFNTASIYSNAIILESI